MQKVLTAEQMREVDRLTTERYGIPSILLMENAAHAVARVITEKLGGSVKGKSVLILCGKGNNGGDGAALARILWQAGAIVYAPIFAHVDDTSGDARVNFESLLTLGSGERAYITSVELQAITEFRVERYDVVVDAVFGTGLSRPVGESLADTFNWYELQARRSKSTLFISIDLPSGLNSDISTPIGPHVSSDMTVTFTAPKPANLLPPSSAFNGELIVANIGSPIELIDEQPSNLFVADRVDLARWLERSDFSSGDYKNKRGHALIVSGSEDYSGAAVMCGNAAMRSGVGLTTLLVPASCKVEVASRVIPEVIVRAVGEADGEVRSDAFAGNQDTISQADSILIGPGLKATDKGVEKFVRAIVESRNVPVILDAGALWFCNPPDGLLRGQSVRSSPPYEGGVAPASGDGVVLSFGDNQVESDLGAENHPVGETPPPLLRKEGSLILTPHEGEFIRLLGTDDKDAIKDRVVAVRNFAVTNNVILVLKGERVLIGSPDGRVVVNPTGNSGLGKAGNGDTLAGILAGFVAQAVKFEIDIFETVVAAVYLAGMAGDVAEKKYGKRVMTASDVRECLVEVFAKFEEKE